MKDWGKKSNFGESTESVSKIEQETKSANGRRERTEERLSGEGRKDYP